MEELYWNLFAAIGSIDAYLAYRDALPSEIEPGETDGYMAERPGEHRFV